MRILITGDKGFVGTETGNYIASKAIEGQDKQSLLVPRYEVFGFDLMDGRDIRDINQLDELVRDGKIERILHLAAIARFSEADADPVRAHSTNVTGTYNVSKVASKYHIPVVYASTGSVYMPIEQEPPITEEFQVRGNSIYGITKALGEFFIMQGSNPWIILRYAHLYGKEKRHHGLVGGFIERIQRGLEPQLYGGQQSNDFTYIRDVARANYLALTAPWDAWNQAYNIGTGEELTAEEAGKIICEAADYKGKVVTNKQRTVDPQRFVYDISKAERMLGFKAEYDFKKGLQEMFHENK